MSQTKIDWCDQVWNPVWGCNNTCEFCYARKFARRFGKTITEKEYKFPQKHPELKIKSYTKLNFELNNFIPTFLESNFYKQFPKKPSRIFVNSMSDIAYWEKYWLDKVLDKIKKNPQHTFLFLTKKPEFYLGINFPSNCLLGATVLNENELTTRQDYLFMKSSENKTFLSIEPILDNIDPTLIDSLAIDWIIIGAETGSRKNKVIPELTWIQKIVDYSKEKKIFIFMKKNLAKIWPGDLIQEHL